MFRTHRFNTYARLAVSIKPGNVTQHQVHLLRGFEPLQHLLIQLFAIFKEVVDRSLLTVTGHQRFNPHLIRLDVVACLTRQDNQLAHHILTREIGARVGLG